MKKFLSLALALIMTLSLVTISAGATEYKDFTDKDEIQYEEAVAVLNRLGIITGYSEGDFRPEGELTRGAAAKIIVSLLIGPEAAEALPTTSSPYPDVPAGNVFAGYISFCKTEEIINGYNDGTFRPTGTLTGFAFAKMLLSALGYDGKVEGFTGSGWTVRVAALGSQANLFNRLDFKGGETVNRETACLLALNTLKATMVQYTGGMNITTSDGSTMVVNPTREYVTSNQDYAAHIDNRKVSNKGNSTSDSHYTVEFGEEHFKDLRMETERSNTDDFGRPSNVWSYKKVTIGTYPVEADFTYTTQVAHDIEGTTDASKVRALGLNGYVVEKDKQTTVLTVNGLEKDGLAKVADIANYTDNGALVEVYVSDTNPDFIDYVVVVQTQLMEVKRVGSDYVALDRSDVDDLVYGYNKAAIDVNVNDVEVDDDYYSTLKELKAGDLVAIVPVTTDGGSSYEVAKAYVPETVTGKLSRVETYGTANEGRFAINVTVGGNKYNIAQWNRDLTGIDGDTIRVTNKDVTLYLDEYGNALKAKDVGDTSNWMVIKNYRQGLVNGSIVTYVNGWDIGGEELTLNVGGGSLAKQYEAKYLPGDLVYYSNATNSNTAEWILSKGETAHEDGVFTVAYDSNMQNGDPYNIKASNTSIRLKGFGAASGGTDAADGSSLATIDTGIKFIYVNIDSDGEVDSIEFVNGVKNTTNDELKGVNSAYKDDHAYAQACVSLKDNKATNEKSVVTGDSAVKAVVIKRESTDASVSNLLYISNYHGSATQYDNDNRPVYGYEAIMMGANGKMVDEKAVVYSYRNLAIGQFARYSKVTAPAGVESIDDNFYELRGYGTGITSADDASSTWSRSAAVAATTLNKCLSNDKYLVRTTGEYSKTMGRAGDKPEIATTHEGVDEYILGNLGDGDLNANNLLNFRGADWVDLRQNVTRIEDIDDLKAVLHHETNAKDVQVSLLFNDNPDNDNFRHVYLVVVTGVTDKTAIETDKFNVTVKVDGVKNEELSKTGLEDKATTTIEYVVPEGKSATYKIDGVANDTKYSAGEKISIPVTINGKSVEIEITTLSANQGTIQLDIKDKDGKNLYLTYEAQISGNDTVVRATLNKWPEWAPVKITGGTTDNTITVSLIGSVLGMESGKAATFSFTSGNLTDSKAIASYAPAGDIEIVTKKTAGADDAKAAAVYAYITSDKDEAVVNKEVVVDSGASKTLIVNLAADGLTTAVKMTITAGATSATGLQTAWTANKAISSNNDLVVSGREAIKAEITGLANLTQLYTVTPSSAIKMNTLPGGTGLADAATVTLTGDPASASGGKTTIKANITTDGLTTANNYGVIVTVKVTTDEGVKEVSDIVTTAATATGIGTMDLDENIDLSKAEVSVEQIAKLAVVGAPTIAGSTYTFTFNREIKLDKTFDAKTNVTCNNTTTTKCTSAVIDPDDATKLIVILDRPVEASKEISLVGTLIQDAVYENNTNTAGVIYTA